MATSISLHGIQKTEVGQVLHLDGDDRKFWSQTITVHFADGTYQTVDLYTNTSSEALIAMPKKSDEVVA